MARQKKIEQILRNAPQVEAPQGLKEKLLSDLAQAGGTFSSGSRVMDSNWSWERVTRYLTAAVFIIGLSIGLTFIYTTGGSSVAWSDVASQMEQINYVHFYTFECRQDRLTNAHDGWYANGKVGTVFADGSYSLDDGRSKTVFDSASRVLREEESDLGNIQGMVHKAGFFDLLIQGVFEYDSSEIRNQKPSHIGKDFLVYRFGSPQKMEQWVKNVSITVGRNSLLPVQMKIYLKESPGAYDMYIFDYEDKGMPAVLAEHLQGQLSGLGLDGKWQGNYETDWGDTGEFVAKVVKVRPDKLQIEVRDSFEDWGQTISQVDAKLQLFGSSGVITFKGTGNMWSGEGSGTIEGSVIKGKFSGDESGKFTLKRVSAK